MDSVSGTSNNKNPYTVALNLYEKLENPCLLAYI